MTELPIELRGRRPKFYFGLLNNGLSGVDWAGPTADVLFTGVAVPAKLASVAG